MKMTLSIVRSIRKRVIRLMLNSCLLAAAASSVHAQNKQIKGSLRTEEGAPVVNANILLKTDNGVILVFGSTKPNGEFSLRIPDTLQLTGLVLEVNHLGFKRVSERLTADKSNYPIVMKVSSVMLAEVKVKDRPRIDLKGDTLSYAVGSFSQRQDRTIGDVLKRMPGIEIEENGAIKYNGKAISNLYIGGDDLLDGRYNLGTRTIPKDVIESVDVMQHHQPIKVLQNKSFTDDVALNLVVKKDAALTLSGQGMLGIGLPGQYDAAFNTLLFNKKFKMLNVFKANNSGIDHREDLTQFSAADFLISMGNTRPDALISAATAGEPDLPKKAYYFNHSNLLDANNLYNFKSGLQLRSNVQAFYDHSSQNYHSLTSYRLNNDTLVYDERQQSQQRPFILNTTLKATLNKEKYYLNDDLRLNYTAETNRSAITLNSQGFDQVFKNKIRDFSNNFRYTPSLRNKNILDISWYLNYYNIPQRLLIDEGLNKAVFNSGSNYAGLDQSAATPTFFSHMYAAYRFNGKYIRQNYQLGILNELQHLDSELELLDNNGQAFRYAVDPANDLEWKRRRVYLNAFYEFKKGSWEWIVSFPLTAQHISYKDNNYRLDKKKDDVFLNPSTRIKYFIGSEDYLQFNYNYNNTVSNISSVYRGNILANYLTLRSNDADLQEQRVTGAGLFYNFQRSLSMLFINAGVSYNSVSSNTIRADILKDDLQESILLPYTNLRTIWNIRAGLSKYIFALGATVSLKSSWSRSDLMQLINDQVFPYRTNDLMLNLKAESKIFGKLAVSYGAIGHWSQGRLKGNSTSTSSPMDFRRYDQNISLAYVIGKDLFLTLKGRYIYNRQNGQLPVNYFFSDANIRYRWAKLRSDVELDVTNLTNIRQYKIYTFYSDRLSYSEYDIRGRMAIARFTFNF